MRSAIKTVLKKKKIEAAVDANRLTRAQADRMIARINDAECVGPLGGGGPGGCHGGPAAVISAAHQGDSERPAAPRATAEARPVAAADRSLWGQTVKQEGPLVLVVDDDEAITQPSSAHSGSRASRWKSPTAAAGHWS